MKYRFYVPKFNMFNLPRLATLLLILPAAVRSTSFLPFLNFTSPSPYMFHSLAALLQQYPQTLFPNGHTIASVTIPRHTLLYHGRHDNDPVPSPEWLAMDIEMAYGIMGSMSNSRMLTYRTTKNVKAVYFDGTSASLIGEGTRAQMVLLYNGTEKIPKRGGFGPPGRGRPGRDHGDDGRKKENDEEPLRRPPPGHWNPLQDEYFRARGLCEWLSSRGLGGPGWGYEGVVRMNAGFEVIWCDFESPSLKMVSNLNVSAPLLANTEVLGMDTFREVGGGGFAAQALLRMNEDEGPHGPGMTDPLEPFRSSSAWFWFVAAARRYFGESRIKVDACGLFSFYEPQLQNQTNTRIKEDTDRLGLDANGKWLSTSKGSERGDELEDLTRRRRQHRLDSVEEEDGDIMLQALEKRLSRALSEDGCSSGVNWHHMSQEIVTQYSNGLQTLLKFLRDDMPSSTDAGDDLHVWLDSTRALTHSFLLPFLEYPPDRPYDKEDLEQLFSLQSPLAEVTLERCQTQYDIDEQNFDDEGRIFYHAIRDTLTGICSTVIEIGLGVEYHWLTSFNHKPSNDASKEDSLHILLIDAKVWKRKTEELLAWLGWADKWTKFPESCEFGVSRRHICSFYARCANCSV